MKHLYIYKYVREDKSFFLYDETYKLENRSEYRTSWSKSYILSERKFDSYYLIELCKKELLIESSIMKIIIHEGEI